MRKVESISGFGDETRGRESYKTTMGFLWAFNAYKIEVSVIFKILSSFYFSTKNQFTLYLIVFLAGLHSRTRIVINNYFNAD